jgi:arginine decarboxylase
MMRICVTVGGGEGPTPLAAFDAALLTAGVENYNLLCLSSVIPPDSTIECARYVSAPEEYGHRLYVVMARHNEQQPGKAAWAGLGWTQDAESRRGLFVEIDGSDRDDVEQRIRAALGAMIASRPYTYGPIKSAVVGAECHGQPVCAVAIAVYKSEGWSDR